jgi:hypothetical protein
MQKAKKTRKAIQTRKATNGRPSPTESATAFPEGRIAVGNNRSRWVVTKTRVGVKRWTVYEKASVGGYKPLTVDILCENIGKPIKVYERSMKYVWPTGPRDFDVRYEINPTGDITFGGKLRTNWLETLKPRLPSRQYSNEVMGTYSSFGNYSGPIHVDPVGKCLVSSNVDNTEAFVKI